jgi:hypothetical protein
VNPHHPPAGDGLELGYFTDVLAVNTTIGYYQGENMGLQGQVSELMGSDEH